MTFRNGTRVRAVATFAFGMCLAGSMPVRAQPAASELTVASLGGESDKTFKAVFVPFEKAHNVTIHWVPGVSAENLAKIAAVKNNPEYDVGLVENLAHAVGSQQNLWAPVDESIVTNYKDLLPLARPKHNDGVGVGVFLAGFFYNGAEFARRGWAPPSSWNDLFRPEFCHHIGILSPTNSYTIHTIIMLGGGDAANADAGIARLGKLKDCIPVMEPSAAKLEEKMQAGEYLVGIAGNIRVGYMIKRGDPINFAFPREGTVVGLTIAAAVRNAPHARMAQEYMNWFLRPEVQEQLMRGLFYEPGNSKVEVPADLVRFGVPDDETRKRLVTVDDGIIVERRRDWTRQIERELSH